MTLGERLGQYADRYYDSREAFAKAVGMTGTEVSNFCTGYRNPNMKNLRRFAEAGVNVQWLLTGEGPDRTLLEQESLRERKAREEMLSRLEQALQEGAEIIQAMRRVI